MQQPWPRRLKTVVFSIVPALVLLGGAEIVCRLCFPLPEIVPFTPEVYEDRDLFWRVKPNLNVVSPRTTKLLRTNELGFRDKPIGPKGESEFRVLCLGESTTYGDYVEFDETYAQVAQQRLNEKSSGIRYRLINAGAPSYSSFQSLILLKKYGLNLKPDAVVLYHEGNDYLPVGWDKRDVTALTDPQRYACLQRAPWLWWLSRLRIYRVPVAWLHRKEPDPQLLDRVYGMFGHRLSDVQTRLSVQQQYETLDEFRSLCAQHHIQLLFMHPTYFSTGRHDCPLTNFARRNGVPLLPTVQLFPATVQAREALFADAAHPNAEGHRRIGEALAEFLLAEGRPSP